jgi:hypothetical protein
MKPQRRVRIQASTRAERERIRRAVLRLGLDRRRIYSLSFGTLTTVARCTGICSGCSCDCSWTGCSHGAYGCKDCGYTGRRTIFFGEPVLVNGKLIELPGRSAEQR